MTNKHASNFFQTLTMLIGAILIMPSTAFAQSTSPNYRVEESVFGTGGELESTSDQYKVRSSVGTLGTGSSSSASFDAEAGFVTPEQPFLAMYVSGASLDLSVLSDTVTSYGAAKAGECDCSFSVRSYLSSEYTVITVSQPPISEGGAILDAKSTLGAPSTQQNTEEFGINLVDNASPDIGASPLNVPDDTFADGMAATGYGTANQFKYGVGDVIARSAATAGRQAVGRTNYTISYIAKRKPLTEAGLYTMNHDLVVVATF